MHIEKYVSGSNIICTTKNVYKRVQSHLINSAKIW